MPDEVDSLPRELGLSSLGLGFAFPEETKAFPMRAQERVGLDDQECLSPVGDVAGQDEQPEAISAVQLWMLDLSVKDDGLLAERGILGDQLGYTSREVSEYASNQGIGTWADQSLEGRLNRIGERAKVLEEKGGERDAQAGRHRLKS